jgi:hypothetical protein
MESFLQNRPSLATAQHYTPQPPGEPGFQPFLRPKTPGSAPAALSSGDATNAQLVRDEAQPQLELVNREGCVERIIVICTWCKRIELQCEY